jgi:hypothetical protein
MGVEGVQRFDSHYRNEPFRLLSVFFTVFGPGSHREMPFLEEWLEMKMKMMRK